MKKIFSILFAGVMALTAVSCFNEPLAVFDPADGTAPIMGLVDVGAKNITVAYTPGVFNLGFNEQMAPTHSLAIVSVDGKAVSRIITSKNDGITLVATNVNISKALTFFGYTDGQQIGSLDIVVRASIQDPSKDNGRNGYLDSEKYTLSNFTVTLPQGSPYADYTESSTWSVIGALSNYDISWNGDLPMITDGKTHVAQGVKLSADDEFKFRKDKAWDVNMGGEFGGLGSEFTVTQDGANIKVGADGIYDLILDPNGSATIVETLGGGVSNKIGGDEPEPEPETVTGWNVIGANGDWENDIIATEKDGVWNSSYVSTGIRDENGVETPTSTLPKPPTSSGARTAAGTRTTALRKTPPTPLARPSQPSPAVKTSTSRPASGRPNSTSPTRPTRPSPCPPARCGP